MKVKIINTSDYTNPMYATKKSSGVDLRSVVDTTINAGETKLISTGIYIQMPINLEAQVRSRSGLALSFDIMVLNSPGTIDADYTGEIKVILKNLSNKIFFINKGDRIAQLVFNKIKRVKFVKKSFKYTKRGNGGFNSTGIK